MSFLRGLVGMTCFLKPAKSFKLKNNAIFAA